MKKITSLVFIMLLFVLITCKNTVSDEVIKNKLLNSIETLGKQFSDAFISSPFGGSLGTAAIDLKKSEVRNYFETISKEFKKIQEGFKKISFDFAEYDGVSGFFRDTGKGIHRYLMDFINSADEAVKAADIGSDLVGEVVIGINPKIADLSSVKGFVKGIWTILETAESFGIRKKIFSNYNSEFNAKHKQVGNVDHIGKLFFLKNNNNDNNGSAASKAKDLVNSVSGEEILLAIKRNGLDAEREQGRTPNIASTPIEAAIGSEDYNNGHGGGCFKVSNPIIIATAIVLRGMAKDGQFAVASSGESDTVRTAVEIGVTKTLVVLTSVLKYSVGVIIEELLDRIRKSPLRFNYDREQHGY
ncbi:variable large family protein [Borreliella carolinensis]|uniref:Variable large family protein n=1 Tax=Borreliella carolinensis TaxID=478174 RepID=A0ACD5GKF5_9SPIR